MKEIIVNSVRCLNCGEVLVSHHVHDYKVCGCKNETMCDGGINYIRFGGKDLSLVESNCLYDDEPFTKIREFIHRGGRGIDGKQPLEYVKLSEMNDDWIEAVIKYEEELRPTNRFLKFYKQEKQYRGL